jgi:hypothetical protein
VATFYTPQPHRRLKYLRLGGLLIPHLSTSTSSFLPMHQEFDPFNPDPNSESYLPEAESARPSKLRFWIHGRSTSVYCMAFVHNQLNHQRTKVSCQRLRGRRKLKRGISKSATLWQIWTRQHDRRRCIICQCHSLSILIYLVGASRTGTLGRAHAANI